MKLFPQKSMLVSAQRRRLLQLAAVGLTTFFLSACQKNKPAGFKEGGRFPDIVLPALDGHITSPTTYQDKRLVVNFWATWCEPCRHEMPSLKKLGALFSSDDLLVIGISVDGDRNLAREFSLRYNLTIPMLSDSEQTLSNDILKIPAFPITYLLKRDHTIASIIIGARDWADTAMVDKIEKSLAVRRK